MSELYYSEKIVGVANVTVYGNGITSTEAEPKILKNVIVNVSGKADNIIEGWYEREKRLDVIDAIFPLYTDAYRLILPIEFDIEVGKTWKIALRCGGNPGTVFVLYQYELK